MRAEAAPRVMVTTSSWCWLKSSWLMSFTTQVHISIPTLPSKLPSANYLLVRFACTFLPQFDISPSPQIHSRKLHSVLPPSNHTTRSLWPPRFSTPRRHPPPARESITPQPLNPPSIDDTTQIRDLRRLSVLEFDIQPTHSLPPFLVSMGSSSSTAPATSLSTQPLKPRWPPNTGSIRNKFNTIISTR